MNIVRSQILCATVGAWAIVPWKVLTSGANFLTAITGMGIFVACMLGILMTDYYFIRKGNQLDHANWLWLLTSIGNYWVEDLYSDAPSGRYWYWHGFHWRAYVAYVCGIGVPFPGFVGAISGNCMASVLNPAGQIYAIGYLVALLVGGATYFALCKISPPLFVDEARVMLFESMARTEVLSGVRRVISENLEMVREPAKS